jgi:phosphoesterase RecJ-like protein
MNLNPNDVSEILDIIESSQNICIAGHKAPDGDCIGSVMAVYEILKPLNKNLTVMMDGIIPFNFKPFVDENTLASSYDGSHFDALFLLDCSDSERLGKFSDALKNAKRTVCIDHHITNKSFCDVNIIAPGISSTGELLYDVFKAAGKEISKKISEYLYIAIVTDTGKFSYSNTSSETHRIAAELIEKGVDVQKMDNILYNSKPADVVKAFIDCVSGIEFEFDNRLGIASITQEILEKNNVDMGDIDGVVEFIREIKEVEVSCVLKEHEGETKVSLRSKGRVDVAEISLSYGGGGHKKAAGFEVKDSVDNTKKLLIKDFKKYFG